MELRDIIWRFARTWINGGGFWWCESTDDVVDMIDGLTGDERLDVDIIVGVVFCWLRSWMGEGGAYSNFVFRESSSWNYCGEKIGMREVVGCDIKKGLIFINRSLSTENSQLCFRVADANWVWDGPDNLHSIRLRMSANSVHYNQPLAERDSVYYCHIYSQSQYRRYQCSNSTSIHEYRDYPLDIDGQKTYLKDDLYLRLVEWHWMGAQRPD